MSEKPTVLKISPPAFLGGLSRFVFGLSTAAPSLIADGTARMVSSLSGGDKANDRAWELISRSIGRAICSMLSEVKESLNLDNDRMSQFVADKAISGFDDLIIPSDFLTREAQAEVVDTISPLIEVWLTNINVSTFDASNISNRLRNIISRSLAEEWKERPTHYASAVPAFSTPFDVSSKYEQELSSYFTHLETIADEQVFDETFSLRQIYLPLRCTWEIPKNERATSSSNDVAYVEKPAYAIGWLEDKVLEWVNDSTSKHHICMVKGGPGSGKSSFAKIIAGKLATLQKRPLFIPLHLLNLKSSIDDAVEEYVKDPQYFTTFSFSEFAQGGCVIIFDGLDEIQLQGRLAQEAAQSFMTELLRFLLTKSGDRRRIISIVTGRDVAVQSTDTIVRSHGISLNVSPYAFNERHHEIIDSTSNPDLKKIDQRDQWWKTYGSLTGLEYTEMPPQLRVGALDDITVHPLLNYLVALAIKQGLSVDNTTDINAVYKYLLRAVYERGWAKSSHPALNGLNYNDFLRLLEEVALCVWHGAGRTTTLKEVDAHCRSHGLGELIDSLKAGATSGISKILLAFYFKQQGARDDGEKTFEFTHKSFAEYLISSRLTRLVNQSAKQLQQNFEDRESGWDSTTCLMRWIAIAGPTALDKYVHAFLIENIRSHSKETVSLWKRHLTILLNDALNQRLPMHRMNLGSHKENCERERNSEECLVACLNACAISLEELIHPTYGSISAMGELINRIQSQRAGPANRLISSCLSYFDFSEQVLDAADFYDADVSHSKFRDTMLNLANFTRADASNCDFTNSQFFMTAISGTIVDGACFTLHSIQRVTEEVINLDSFPDDTEKPRRSLDVLKRRGAIIVGTSGKRSRSRR